MADQKPFILNWPSCLQGGLPATSRDEGLSHDEGFVKAASKITAPSGLVGGRERIVLTPTALLRADALRALPREGSRGGPHHAQAPAP